MRGTATAVCLLLASASGTGTADEPAGGQERTADQAAKATLRMSAGIEELRLANASAPRPVA